MEYEKLKKFIEKKNIAINKNGKEKGKTKLKSFSNLSASEKWGILEEVLRDLGYVE